jgi:prevent-host-death family protein
MQTTIGAFQAKTHFSSLLSEVEEGNEITITKHGRAVAKLVPINAVSKVQVEDAIAELIKMREQHTLGDLDWKALRDEGRR